MLLVHARRAVVLPAALIGQLVVRPLAGDEVMHAAPLGTVQGMNETAGGILPGCHALRADGIRRAAIEDMRLGVEVRIARQHLALAIDKQLVGDQVIGHLGLEDAVLVGLPAELGQ